MQRRKPLLRKQEKICTCGCNKETDEILHLEDGGLVWCAYPEGGEVGKAIIEYRDPDVAVNLHDFLQKYKQLRMMIEEVRGKR